MRSRTTRFGRWLVALLLCCALLGACAGGTAGERPESLPPQNEDVLLTDAGEPESDPEPAPEPVEHRVRFSAVGDNLIHYRIYNQARQRAGGEGYDFAYAYENVTGFFAGFDVNWINQESLITTLEPSTYPLFSTPPQLAQAAYDAGWRVFSLSNNHSYDKGAVGISETLAFWSSMPGDTLAMGFYSEELNADDIALHTVNGITIAYLAFTEHTNGLPTPGGAEASVIYTSETERMQALVETASILADVVVVSAHWGTEDSHTVNDNQRDLAAQFAAWGAHVVIGTHPHVAQAVEWVDRPDGGQTLVAYSLGNFLSTQAQPKQVVGLCLTFELVMETTDGLVTAAPMVENVQVYPTITHYEWDATNVRCYMLGDYTEELAAVHGVRANGSFDMAYILNLLQTHVDPEFLVLG